MMASVKAQKKSASSSTAVVRPLWYYRPGGIPIAATSKKAPKDATVYCHEGDEEWTPIAQEHGGANG